MNKNIIMKDSLYYCVNQLIHKDYSYKYKEIDLDQDVGLVAGFKLGKHFGIFGEGRYLSYWGIESYEVKAGVNYVFF